MTKKDKTLQIIEILKYMYPDADCTLDYNEPWQLLVGVRLAAQCTDARVNIVTKKLFDKYPTLNSLSQSTPEEIEKFVRPCGLGKSKARDIHACCNILINNFNSIVPATMEELLSLPGVGRKSANLVLGDIYGKPAIVTDTHCIRICNHFGLTSDKDPKKVEMALWKLIPLDEGNDFCHRIVIHGRAICTARSPKCEICDLNKICKTGVSLKL